MGVTGAGEYIGRHAGRSTPGANGRLALAVDLGGSRLRVAIVDGGGGIRARHDATTPAADGPEAVVGAILAAVGELLPGGAASRCAAVAVAAPGPLDPVTGVVLAAPNLPGWSGYPLADRLTAALGMPVLVRNDANLAALGESLYGAGRNRDPLVYLTVSTGVGGAIVQGGHVVEGATGLAGELGHAILLAGGPACNLGHEGCLEALCSGTAIALRAREEIARGRESLLRERARTGGAITAHDVATAAAAGDPLALEVWTRATTFLGLAIGSFINIFDPARVIVGGGVSRSWPLLREPLLAAAGRVVMSPERRRVDVVPAALGDDSGLLGAAACALEHTAY